MVWKGHRMKQSYFMIAPYWVHLLLYGSYTCLGTGMMNRNRPGCLKGYKNEKKVLASSQKLSNTKLFPSFPVKFSTLPRRDFREDFSSSTSSSKADNPLAPRYQKEMAGRENILVKVVSPYHLGIKISLSECLDVKVKQFDSFLYCSLIFIIQFYLLKCYQNHKAIILWSLNY